MHTNQHTHKQNISNHSNSVTVAHQLKIFSILLAKMDDFCVLFNLYGEYGNFDKWAEAQDKLDDLEKTLKKESNSEKRYKELTL